MSDYETTQAKRNVTVGIFVIVALVAVVWLIYKFGDLPIRVSEYNSFQLYVQFPMAQGMEKNTSVRFCGYPVGRVTNVRPPKLLQDRRTSQLYHQTLVTISIDKKYNNIPSNVEIKLMTRGLGSSYIELVQDLANLPAPAIDPNRPETTFLTDNLPPLQGSTGTTSEFFPAESQKKLDELADNLNSLIKNANDIFGDQANKENFKLTLANLAEVAEQAKKTLAQIEELTASGKNTLKNTDVTVKKGLASFMDVSEQLSKAAAEMRLLLEKVNSGQGSAGRFVNDGKLYENMLENTEQLQILLKEFTEVLTKLKEKGLQLKL